MEGAREPEGILSEGGTRLESGRRWRSCTRGWCAGVQTSGAGAGAGQGQGRAGQRWSFKNLSGAGYAEWTEGRAGTWGDQMEAGLRRTACVRTHTHTHVHTHIQVHPAGGLHLPTPRAGVCFCPSSRTADRLGFTRPPSLAMAGWGHRPCPCSTGRTCRWQPPWPAGPSGHCGPGCQSGQPDPG